MIILGFTFWKGSHDSSAALVRDGELVAAAEEERFTRRKHDGAVPLNAIDYCLHEAGVTMKDVSFIAYPDRPFRTGPNSQLAEMSDETLRGMIERKQARRRSSLHKRAIRLGEKFGIGRDAGMHPMVAQAFSALTERYGVLPPVRYYGHHLSHAAAAFLTSGFDEAAVLTLDGRGGPFSGTGWAARGTSFTPLAEEPYTNSLGWFYRDCTRYAGLGDFGEGKLMGLAPYGVAGRQVGTVQRLLDTVNARWFAYRQPPLQNTLGFPPRQTETVLDAPWPDFAAAVQHGVERAVDRAARSVVGSARSTRLCIGGGVALNCSANGKLLAAEIADDIWLFPASGDAGLSVGAALLCARDQGELHARRLDSPYWGPAFTDAEIEEALGCQVDLERPGDFAGTVAEAIADGNIVGWFQGRMELGPRALGGRSILADPRTTETRDRVNRVKRRERWRPLAPSVLAEKAGLWFERVPPNAFMLFAVQATPLAKERARAVVHVDGSARPQPVSRSLNAPYYDLLKAFDELTGVPILLNTSFNAAGEPIVCSPTDALRTFLATDLDLLAIGPFIARKKR
jgi:carbamoyltransferase